MKNPKYSCMIENFGYSIPIAINQRQFKFIFSIRSSAQVSSIISGRTQSEVQINELQSKLDASCKRQHEIENILEDYEVMKNQQQEEIKETNRKYYDLQKLYTIADKERKELIKKVTELQQEKDSVTKKWVRAVSLTRSEDKSKGILHFSKKACR